MASHVFLFAYDIIYSHLPFLALYGLFLTVFIPKMISKVIFFPLSLLVLLLLTMSSYVPTTTALLNCTAITNMDNTTALESCYRPSDVDEATGQFICRRRFINGIGIRPRVDFQTLCIAKTWGKSTDRCGCCNGNCPAVCGEACRNPVGDGGVGNPFGVFIYDWYSFTPKRYCVTAGRSLQRQQQNGQRWRCVEYPGWFNRFFGSNFNDDGSFDMFGSLWPWLVFYIIYFKKRECVCSGYDTEVTERACETYYFGLFMNRMDMHLFCV